jgi:hypothetical protein
MKVRMAYSFAEELGMLKYFPSNSAAVTKIAELIAELCANEKQARVLVDAMCKRFDEWPGPVTLRQVYQEMLGPVQTPGYTVPFGPPPPSGCGICDDRGFFRTAAKKYRRCGCPSSLGVSDEMLEYFNTWQDKQRGAMTRKTITRKQLEDVEIGADGVCRKKGTVQ